MIELTVKTLDSHNHQFSVEDDMTVGQFKEHIAEKVSIPAATQRIIYCGRVLQDNDKLSDYDVNGKVVHLVQRAPPSANQRGNQSSGLPTTDNTNHNRGAGGAGGFMGFDRVGNAVYLGSMAMSNEPTHIPQRATHNLSASRLNAARRMLRGAEHAIHHLENPNEAAERSPPSEPNTDEEITPVIEARVVVPTNSDQPMDESAVISAVENSLFGDPGSSMQVYSSQENSENVENPESGTNDAAPDSTTSETPTSQASPTNNDANNGNGGRNSRVRTARGPEMAELLTTLNQLQARFAPFLARYQTFLQDDPQVATENVESTRKMLRLVSQTMHYLSHAYHSLSDIMINVEQAPPRLLMCRPILIQQSAMVHAGIPFQVEAQINVLADPPATPGNNGAINATPRGTDANSQGTTTPPTGTANGQQPVRALPTSIPNANINITQGPSTNMEFVGLPFMPSGGSMRVITTPIEIRAVRPGSANARAATPSNNNNSAQNQASQETGAGTPPSSDTPTDVESPPQSQPQGPRPQLSGPTMTGPFGPNSNMEFVVEVTPEVFRGAMNGPPPEFIQSLMQLVNSQLFPRPPLQPGQQQQAPGQRSNGSPNNDAEASTQPSAAGATVAGQNSQARVFSGNTQTNPTTSTHTRSTSRPHIQMTQQAVQGGFDPYLPCYSHHVVHHHHRHRIISPVSSTSFGQGLGPPGQPRNSGSSRIASSNSSNQNSTRETPILQNLFGNLVTDPQNLDEIMAVSRAAENLVTMLTNSAPSRQQQPQQQQQQSSGGDQQQQQLPTSQSTRRASDQSTNPSFPPTPPASFLASMLGGNIGDINMGITLDQLRSSLNPDDSYTPGTSLFMDLLMLMLGNLRLTDLFLLNSGNLTPLNQSRTIIQNFIRTTVCRNDVSPEGLQRATDRVLEDMQNFIGGFDALEVPTRDNIDLVASIEALLRHHIPLILNQALDLTVDDVRPLVDKVSDAGKQCLALILHCAVNGRRDLEGVLEAVMERNMPGIPEDIQVWTNAHSRVLLNHQIRSLNVPNADIQQFIVHRSQEVRPKENEERPERRVSVRSFSEVVSNGHERMDVDTTSDSSPAEANHVDSRLEDDEPLPNVVFGSESWHRETNEDWVPIITRDVYKQRRQSSQPPFSDAYLSGMPSKRRKLINSSKPQNGLPQVIKESLRQAVTTSGVASSSSVESVVSAAGASTEILTAYRNMLHATVQENLRENEDFDSEQFPNASSYFSKSAE